MLALTLTEPEKTAHTCGKRRKRSGTGAVLVPPLLPLTTRPECVGEGFMDSTSATIARAYSELRLASWLLVGQKHP